MSAAVTSRGGSRATALAFAVQPRTALIAIAALSTAVRSAAATLDGRPIYLPDEYLYTAIARAFAGGHLPSVRGHVVAFPGILAPLLAAPFQAAFSPEVAYRLTQCENALVMSLAVFPVYLLARRLQLAPWYAVGCSLFAVAIPDLVFAGFTASDAVAYPIVLSTLAVGLMALVTPRWQTQVGFLALAAVAASARAQYVVVPISYLVAAAVIDRRAFVRRHSVVVGAFALAVIVVFVAGASRATGMYAATLHFHLNAHTVEWAFIDLFFLACVTGVALVPGAVAGLVCARTRAEQAFAVAAGALTLLLVAEAAVFSTNIAGRFEERYLFVLLPLVPIAFGVYLRNGRPAGRLALALSAVLLLVASRLQVTSYSVVPNFSDSPFLFAYYQLESWMSVGNTALVGAAAASAGAMIAAVVVWRGHGTAAFVAAIAMTAAIGVVAVKGFEGYAFRGVVPVDGLSWIDDARVGKVTYVRAPRTPLGRALQDLYWNKSIDSEVRLAKATATDGYAPVPKLRIDRAGRLINVHSAIAFESWSAFARWAKGTRVRGSDGLVDLVSASTAPRLSLLEVGRYFDSWLADSGRIEVWPAPGHAAGTISFVLSLPVDHRATTLTFGRRAFVVRPGATVRVTLHVHGSSGPISIPFRSNVSRQISGLRIGSVRSTPPIFEPYRPTSGGGRIRTSVG